MLTTFARLAKVIKGLVSPANWVEDAFANIGGGGGSDGALIVHEDENGVLDKTWQEISDALKNSTVAIVFESPNIVSQTNVFMTGVLRNVATGNTDYSVHTFDPAESSKVRYVTNSADDYPVMDENP